MTSQRRNLSFLGISSAEKGSGLILKRLKKMVNMGSPKNLKELRSKLGLFSFYCQYIKGFSSITKPMYELTQMKNKKYVPFVWNEKRQKAFDNIKKRMMIVLIVTYPNFEKPFILYTNASGEGIGLSYTKKMTRAKNA